MERIFTDLMNWHMRRIKVEDENIQRVFRFAIDATVEIYTNILANLKPTPAKSHYLFNMRDVSRVVQGLQLISKPQITDDKFVTELPGGGTPLLTLEYDRSSACGSTR